LRGMQHLKATGEGPVLNRTLELAAMRRNGEEFPVEIVIWPLKMGGETSYHAFVRDITARKEAAERIQKLNEELKQRAELLEIANKELESFSYSVSHDLRAPLRHIHGFVELLQNSPSFTGDETSHRHLSVIARAAKDMGRLIDDLLAFSRTGRAEMHPVSIDLREMIDHLLRDGAIDLKGRQIAWDIKPLPRVWADPSLLRLVWTNLLENAVKYTQPRKEAKIEVGHMFREGEAGERESVFYVRDNGVGFDMQYASKLFGVFQRLHRAEDFEGTGIGLANVQRIVHRHGGRVWAEAQVDVGATFFFSLPSTQSPNGANHYHGQDQTNSPGRR
jgi:light-regulated signal transduction histidine kinase (bacteriophytochrome)